jgi:GMP synthase-like glutamine amidotransferase
LRVPEAPIWATQFHPELDEQGNRDRCVASIKEFGQIEGYQALPSPDALTILPKFLDRAVQSSTSPVASLRDRHESQEVKS